MPIPKPKKDESQDDFISRCMGDDIMQKDFPEQEQRSAVCFSTWRKRNNMRALVNFRGQTGKVRTETFKGQEHVVIPITALVEGVMQAENAPHPELVEEEIFSRTFESWNGRPTMINHPRKNGQLVSANSPDILENEQVGTVFNAEVKDGKLVLEAWIDRSLSNAAGGKKKDAVDRAAEGETIEVSVGAFVDVEQKEGTFNGRAFEGRWINIVPDHLALLEEGKIGACSIEDGCGSNRAAEGISCGPGCVCKRAGGDPEKLHDRILAAFRTAPGEVMTVLSALAKRLTGGELSDNDRRVVLETALSNQNPDDFIFVVAVFDERLVYAQGMKLFQRDYSIKDDNIVTFGESVVEVTPRTDFIAVTKHDDEEDPNPNKDDEKEEERDMTRAEKVKGLIENPKTRFGEADEEWLTALEDGQIEKLEPEEEKPDDPAADPGSADGAVATPATDKPTVQTAEQYLEAAPAEVREVLSEGLALQRQRKEHFIEALSKNPRNGFTKEALDSMDTETLAGMARLADLPDYSARATSAATEPADDPMRAPKMPAVFDLNAHRKAS